MNIQNLIETLKRHEGLELKPYTDTVGKLTIGVGRNLSDNGISELEADFLLENDIMNAYSDLVDVIGLKTFDELGEIRQGVLINMIFNLGKPRFRTFKKMIAAVKADDPEEVAVQMQDSRWFNQVKGRGIELVWQFRHNKIGAQDLWQRAG
ncbi:lysozyme [Candidatus Poribacteria bacterium]|nr:lysozyme [Candidatus Poribacteria bacterium]